MKLEQKHLAPYLPYGLKIRTTTTSHCEYYLGFDIEIDSLGVVGLRTPDSWLPIVNWIPLYQKLFELHLDVFGLIEKGLAIDINKVGGL